jgi:Chalcone isomerase-like
MQRRQWMRRTLVAAAPWAVGLASPAMARVATARPPELAALGSDVRLLGQQRFRYWGFHVYDAQLWVRPGFEPQRFAAHPFMLSLTYARTLLAADIAARSLEEIARQGPVDERDAQRWQDQLQAVLVDVRPSDRLSGLYQPTDQGRFFANGRATGVIRDAQLMPKFFGVWLAPQTSAPSLRRALLGLDGAMAGDRHEG